MLDTTTTQAQLQHHTIQEHRPIRYSALRKAGREAPTLCRAYYSPTVCFAPAIHGGHFVPAALFTIFCNYKPLHHPAEKVRIKTQLEQEQTATAAATMLSVSTPLPPFPKPWPV